MEQAKNLNSLQVKKLLGLPYKTMRDMAEECLAEIAHEEFTLSHSILGLIKVRNSFVVKKIIYNCAKIQNYLDNQIFRPGLVIRLSKIYLHAHYSSSTMSEHQIVQQNFKTYRESFFAAYVYKALSNDKPLRKLINGIYIKGELIKFK